MSKNPPKPNTSPEHVKETAETFTRRERLARTVHNASSLTQPPRYAWEDLTDGDRELTYRIVDAIIADETDCPPHTEARELLEAVRLILPLAKGYAPEGQSDTAKATCRSWIEAAEEAIAKAEGRTLLATPAQGEDISSSRDHALPAGFALETREFAQRLRAEGEGRDNPIPPGTPTPDRMRGIVQAYRRCLLVAADTIDALLSSAEQIAGRGPGMQNNTSATPTQEGVGREEIALTGRVHELKTWPEYFEAVASDRKRFEIRQNDRRFAVGDTLLLREWDPETEQYTGRAVQRAVSYILDGAWMFDGYVALSLLPAPKPVQREELTDDLVVDAMQTAWDEYIAETGCFPNDFKITRGPKLWFTAGDFARSVAMYLRTSLPAPKPGEGEHLQALLDGLGYDRVFNAIADATRVAEGGGIGISVEAFIASVSDQPNRIEERADPGAGERDHIAEHLEATRQESIQALQRAAASSLATASPQQPAPGAPRFEPTDAMIEAGVEAWHKSPPTLLDETVARVYRAMSAAAPGAPGAPEGWREAAEKIVRLAAFARGNEGFVGRGRALAEIEGLARAALTSSSAKPVDDAQRWYDAYCIAHEQATANGAANRRLREGLEPFAAIAAKVDDDREELGLVPVGDDYVWADDFGAQDLPTWGDFRRARAALKDSALGEDGGASRRAACDTVNETSEDPRLIAANYTVTCSNGGREHHWRPPEGPWHDGYSSERAAARAALKHLQAARSALGDAQARTEGE